MRADDLDAMLINNERDVHYLSGLPGEASTMVVPARGRPVIISDFRFQETLEPLKSWMRVVIRATGVTMLDAIAKEAARLKVNRLGIQGDHMTVAMRDALAKKIGAKKLRPSSGVLDTLRMIKDASEVATIRKAVKIQEAAMLATLPTIESGQTEFEICARLEYEMKIRGAEGPSFDPIVAAKANGSLPHATPGRTKTAMGKPLLIDWGALVDGYASDMTRTFSLGRWPRKVREIYGIVHEAFLAGCDAVKPGVSCHDVDEAARSIIRDAGYGPEFGHSLGHGIGLNIHEEPRLSQRNMMTLQPGMVVTIEPGIYLPGVGGVRIEDDMLVTERGSRRLSSLPHDLEWATL